jgi:hypothetical protein
MYSSCLGNCILRGEMNEVASTAMAPGKTAYSSNGFGRRLGTWISITEASGRRTAGLAAPE